MKRLDRQFGMSLLEVVVALLILSIAVLGFLAVGSRSLLGSGQADFRSQAVTLISGHYDAVQYFDEHQKRIYVQTLAQSIGSASDIDDYIRQVQAVHIECQAACSRDTLAKLSAWQLAQSAATARMTVLAKNCQTGICWALAWGDDAPQIITDCFNPVPKNSAHCFVLGDE
ncbi:prepilin-type N-terminal cleavage/methylation domain-containing protein [uncultured Moraxella sp.]|uniref:type IV pilus modification PilV family protein n=1 Tax=uncultured Moraxella sp. TaxID=263769 RepID=UPI0025F07945|nr:prepilin-type N-terminal cleavage/methylation domain-containing protein [uncultured Moraxella sp.]